MKKITAIPKDQHNEKQNFNYRSIDAVYNQAQKLFAEHGVFAVPQVQENFREQVSTKSGHANRTVLKIKYTFFASDASFVDLIAEGEGIDSGDKSTSKASTMAHKTALLQLLMVPTNDVDPDGESVEILKKTETKKSTMKEAEKPKDSQHVSIMDLPRYEIEIGGLKGQALGTISPDKLQAEAERARKYIKEYPRAKTTAQLVVLVDAITRFLRTVPNEAPGAS